MPLSKLIILFFSFVLIASGCVVFFFWWKTQHAPQQEEFLTGKIPQPLPNGLYKGTVNGKETTWQGKKFNTTTSTGINIFKISNNNQELYPFKTYTGPGVADHSLKTMKIDYNVNNNPLWLRLIVDEVVEVSPGHFLGKLNVRLLPNFAVPLGFFELTKTE
jgi:hypothetical protein